MNATKAGPGREMTCEYCGYRAPWNNGVNTLGHSERYGVICLRCLQAKHAENQCTATFQGERCRFETLSVWHASRHSFEEDRGRGYKVPDVA